MKGFIWVTDFEKTPTVREINLHGCIYYYHLSGYTASLEKSDKASEMVEFEDDPPKLDYSSGNNYFKNNPGELERLLNKDSYDLMMKYKKVKLQHLVDIDFRPVTVASIKKRLRLK